MPIEYVALQDAPYAKEECQLCGARFPEALRGLVQRSKRSWLGFRRPYCAVICHVCFNIIGWEAPDEKDIERALKLVASGTRKDIDRLDVPTEVLL